MKTTTKQIKILRIIGYSWLMAMILLIFRLYFKVMLNNGVSFEKSVSIVLDIDNILIALLFVLPGLIMLLISERLHTEDDRLYR